MELNVLLIALMEVRLFQDLVMELRKSGIVTQDHYYIHLKGMEEQLLLYVAALTAKHLSLHHIVDYAKCGISKQGN